MINVTMIIDEELLKKARKLAVERNTSISELFREYISSLTRQEEIRREFIADELDNLFAASRAVSYGRKTNRDELHDR